MGCQQSAPVERKPIVGVGQTERLVSRAERIKRQQSGKGKSSDRLPPPKLDACGNLMPEEVVKRTNSSITCKEVILGTKGSPINIEVCTAFTRSCLDLDSWLTQIVRQSAILPTQRISGLQIYSYTHMLSLSMLIGLNEVIIQKTSTRKTKMNTASL